METGKAINFANALKYPLSAVHEVQETLTALKEKPTRVLYRKSF